MPDNSPILNLPFILPAQAQKHVTHNEAIRLLDMIVQLAVTSRTLTTPPATPAIAERYIVGVGATGAWAGKANQIAVWGTTGWVYVVPLAGWQAYVTAEQAAAIFNGTAWTVLTVPSTVPLLGVNATADTTNRLSVSAPATLLNNAGAGHQVKVNKAAVADTASLLFQTGFSGRAEMGLAGNDDFSVKVSANGSAFFTAMQADAASGSVTLPQPMRLGGQAADPASPVNGTLWLNTTTGEVKLRTAGATISVGAGGSGGVTDGDKGDVVVSGVGTVWTVDAGAITLGKMANLATSTIIGRATAGTGVPEALTAAQVRTVLNVASGATANSADAVLLARANHTGTQAASTITGLSAVATSGSAADLTAGTLPAARFDDTAHGLRAGGGLHAAATTAVAGFMAAADKTKLDGVAAGATVNSADAVLLARANHTGTQLAATIGDFASAVAATAAVAANTAKVTNATHTGDVTGATALTIANDAVTYAKMQNAGANTVLARAAATAGDVGEVALGASQLFGRGATGDIAPIILGTNLTMAGTTLNAAGGGGGATDITYNVASRTVESSTGADAVLPLVSDTAAGLAPASGGGTANFLRADGSWAAPSGGAALSVGDWWESYRVVPTATQFGPFLGAAISSGVNSGTIPTSASLGHNPFGAFIRSSTTANSGYRYMTTSQATMFFGGGLAFKFRGKFLWRAFTGSTVRIGFHDALTITDAADGAYFEIVDAVVSCKTANNSVRTTAGTTLTALVDRVYTFDIDVDSTGANARFRVYENLGGTAVLDQTITTNIPTTFARAFGAGVVATNSGTVAVDIGVMSELGMGTLAAFQRNLG